jgi:protein TonB
MSFDKSVVSVDLSAFLQLDPPSRKRLAKTIALSGFVQALVVPFLVVLPYLYVTDQLPKLPMMRVMLAGMPAPPPAPAAPPPPARRAVANEPDPPSQLPSKNPNAAPIDVPSSITPGNGIEQSSGSAFGVEGGVEGGIPGGVVGGIVGGTPSAPPPLPPPPPPPQPTMPIRIGGPVMAPALIHRVEPKYPEQAAQAGIEGLVILEATVDIEGRVQSVEVLGPHGRFDQAAIDAVKQWRYSPLVLNGKPFPFILTVTVRFAVPR